MEIVATFEFACEALSTVTNVPLPAKSTNATNLPDYMLGDNLHQMLVKTSGTIQSN